jgi:hypothetical protein
MIRNVYNAQETCVFGFNGQRVPRRWPCNHLLFHLPCEY